MSGKIIRNEFSLPQNNGSGISKVKDAKALEAHYKSTVDANRARMNGKLKVGDTFDHEGSGVKCKIVYVDKWGYQWTPILNEGK